MKYVVIYIFVLVIGITQSGFAQQTRMLYEEPSFDTKKNENIIALIRRLPEVKAYLAANRNHKTFVMLEDIPNKDNNERYTITVGLDQPSKLFTFWRFYVDDKSKQIYFFDLLSEEHTDISLKTWRKWALDPAFNRPHKFVNGKLVPTEKN